MYELLILKEMLNSLSSSLYGHIIPELSPVDPSPPETEEEEIEREEEQYIEVREREATWGRKLSLKLSHIPLVLWL